MSKIIKTRISPIKQLVYLTFDDTSYFPISIDDYYHLHPDSYHPDLVKLSLVHLLKQYALGQIAISPKSLSLLTLKIRRRYYQLLRRYHYPEPAPVDQLLSLDIIPYLQTHHLIDDSAYVEHLIRRHPTKSTRHLIFLLTKSGISRSQYAPYLVSLNQQENQKIRRLLPKLSHLPYSKLLSWFANRGFSIDSIKSVIDETRSNR